MELVNKFTAKKKNGTVVTLLEYHHFKEVGDRSGSQRILTGKSITTEDGQKVNYLEQGKFEIVATGEILISDDPASGP